MAKVILKKSTPAMLKASVDIKKRSGDAGLALEEKIKINNLEIRVAN